MRLGPSMPECNLNPIEQPKLQGMPSILTIVSHTPRCSNEDDNDGESDIEKGISDSIGELPCKSMSSVPNFKRRISSNNAFSINSKEILGISSQSTALFLGTKKHIASDLNVEPKEKNL